MGLTTESLFRWVITRRRIICGAAAILIPVGGAYSLTVPIDYGMEQFFPAFGVERETYDEFRQHFFKEDTQFALFWEDEREPGLELFRDLEAVAELFEDVGLTDVEWFGNVEVTETVLEEEEPATRFYRLADEPDLTDESIRGMLERQRGNELFRGLYWNEQQTVFAVHGYIPPERNNDGGRRETEGALTAALDSLGAENGESRLAGLPVFRSRIPKMLEVDQRLFLGGGFVVFFLVLLYFFRNVRHVSLCLVSVLPAYVSTVALIGMTGRTVSILTSFIPIIVLVVGGSDAIHLLTRYRRNRKTATDDQSAIIQTFSEIADACFYTSITTSLGFFSLVGTRIEMIMEFGVFTAIAIMLTYGFSMTVLPAVLAFGPPLNFDDRGLHLAWIRATIRAAIATPARYARPVVLLFGLAAATGMALGSQLEVKTYLLNDMRRDSRVVGDMQWVEERGFGLWQANLFMRSDGEGALHDPTMLEWTDNFLNFARAQPVVIDAVGLPDVMRELRRGILEEGDALPQSIDEATQLLFLTELGDYSVEDLYRQDAGLAQAVLAVRDDGSQVMRPFLDHLEQYMSENPPPFGSAVITGTAQMKLSYSTQLVRTFGPTLVLAVLLVFAVLVQMFGSVRTALVTLIPNFFPLVAIMAAMKLGGVDLKPSTIMVFSIAFGLAVDDTMHLLDTVRDRLREGANLTQAIEDGLLDTGPAILMTSVTMSAGFLLLTGSQFQILVLVGVMTVVSAAAAVAADLFLLPSLLTLTQANKKTPTQ